MTTAEDEKSKGNDAFKKQNYRESLRHYLEAIKLDSHCAVYFANAAACYTKLNDPLLAIEMANEALCRDPSNTKACYRRGINRMAIGELRMALADLKTVCKAFPNDRDAKVQMQECEKLVAREAFAKAIRVSVFELSNRAIAEMPVDSSYGGPRFEGEDVDFGQILALIDYFKQGKRLPVKYACQILLQAKKAFQGEPTLVELTCRHELMTVCGDTHGQFLDVLQIFAQNGFPSSSHGYIFNGDFVDRGPASVEVFLLFCALKAAHPLHFFLTRGNHEADTVNKFHGFWDDCGRKFPMAKQQDIFSAMNSVMNCIPLAMTVYGQYFIVHGGIPKMDLTLEDIRQINRFQAPQTGSLMSHLLWSDPQAEPGIHPSHRGEGVLFGPDVTESFLDRSSLRAIIRSHVWEPTGFKHEHFDRCITIFSAPNYIPGTPSPAAYINITPDGSLVFRQFNAAQQ